MTPLSTRLLSQKYRHCRAPKAEATATCDRAYVAVGKRTALELWLAEIGKNGSTKG